MRDRSIALIGFRATGKTSVGRLLASMLHRDFIDMDQALVLRLGLDIQSWVRQHGWDSFRDEETALLQELAAAESLVVATGGGVVERETNRRILTEHFCTVWLTASTETILDRLAADPSTESQRPALTTLSPSEEVREVLRRRSPMYAECARLEVDTEQLSQEEAALRIATLLSIGQ